MIQRRLYLYIVAGASLAMLLVGLSNLGTTAIDQALRTGGPTPSPRDAYAGFGAMTLVGLPVFVLHWGIAQRLSARHAEERASSLRRLYLYLAMAAIAIALTVFLRRLLEAGFAAVGGSAPVTDAIAGSAWISIVLLAFWLYHLRVAAQDRLAVGEEGAGATLRRWYSYGLLLLGLALLLFGAQGLLQQLWVLFVDRQHTLSAGGGIASALATTLIGLAVWTFHSLLTGSSSIAEADRPSTLRAVAGFLALAVSVVLALVGASRLLYYALARALGVAHPGGVGDDLLVAVAAPGSAVIVFGFAWVWLRAQLARDAGEVEGPRRSGVRRVYTHLVAFLALATLAVGAAGLLWTLSDQLLTPLTGLTAGEWRDRTSLFITLAVVGTPMWILHWRPSPPAPLPLRLAAGERPGAAGQRRHARLPPARNPPQRLDRRLRRGSGRHRAGHLGDRRRGGPGPLPLACPRPGRGGPAGRGAGPAFPARRHLDRGPGRRRRTGAAAPPGPS